MNVRLRVLRVFKELHKARLVVFQADVRALDEGRQKINEEFRKNLKESDPAKHVIQFEEVDESTFRANITPDTYKLDNSLFRAEAEIAYKGHTLLTSYSGKYRTKNYYPHHENERRVAELTQIKVLDYEFDTLQYRYQA